MEWIESRVGNCENEIHAIKKEIWHGNGHPSLITRVTVMERCIEQMSNNLRWLVRLAVGTFLTGLAAFILGLVKH